MSHGHIFDLDYTKSPEITDVLTYFKKMFGVSAVNDKHLVVRVIAADEYANIYTDNDQNRNSDYFIKIRKVIILFRM